MPLIQSDCSIFWLSTSRERVYWYLSFLSSREVTTWNYNFWLDMARCVSWPVNLLTNQIAGFFDRQYLWYLNLSKITSYGWLWPVVSLIQSFYAGFFDQQYHLKEPIHIFDFIHEDNHQGKLVSWATIRDWVLPGVRLVQSDSRILWSIYFSGRNLFWNCFFASFIKVSRCPFSC